MSSKIEPRRLELDFAKCSPTLVPQMLSFPNQSLKKYFVSTSALRIVAIAPPCGRLWCSRTYLSLQFSHLSLTAPDVLEETVTLSQTVHGIVALTHGTDETAEGIDVVLAGNGTTVLVDLGNRDLDRAVILGVDDAVGSAALAGDVAAQEEIATLVYKFVIFRQLYKIRYCFSRGCLTDRRSRHGRSPSLRLVKGDMEWD